MPLQSLSLVCGRCLGGIFRKVTDKVSRESIRQLQQLSGKEGDGYCCDPYSFAIMYFKLHLLLGQNHIDQETVRLSLSPPMS